VIRPATAQSPGGGNSHPPASRRSRQRAERRERLLDAARELFSTRGYARATVTDVSERADLGHGTFYLYFQSKEQLLHALVDQAINELAARLPHALDDRTPAIAMLRQGVLVTLEWFTTHRGVLLALREALLENSRLLQQWDPARRALERWVIDCINRGERQGIARPADRERASALTVNLLIGAASELSLDVKPISTAANAELADEIARYCGHALFDQRRRRTTVRRVDARRPSVRE
jgi:AcrR family transcriptional regulator